MFVILAPLFALEDSMNNGITSPDPRFKPILMQLDGMADQPPVIQQRVGILVPGKILSENHQSTRLCHAVKIFHAGIRVTNMIQQIDHHRQIEVGILEWQLLQGMVVQGTRGRLVHGTNKSQFESHVGSDQRVGKHHVFHLAEIPHQANIRVGTATHFDQIVNFLGKKRVIVELTHPPDVPVIPPMFWHQPEQREDTPRPVLAEFATLALGVHSMSLLPVLSLLPDLMRGFTL